MPVYGLLEKLEAKKGIKYRIAVEQIYLQNRTLDDTAKMLYVCRETIRQMNDKSLKYIKFLSRNDCLEDYLGKIK